MVKNGITVFARIKPETSRKRVKYEIHRRPKRHSNEDFLVINGRDKFAEYIDNRPESWKFSFHRIFEHDVTQVDIFESVARPIVDSVFDGYNATIFAYGQTGSGKTYTISGESETNSEQGILPRTLEYIFNIVQKNPENLYTVEVAYLEIYNENGYDLLLDREEREAAATRLEDLPRVTIQEDESGTMHLKNLSFRVVHNEKEAIQFLIDGDMYRAISETPMNPRSSRSHCIFTIVLSVKKIGEDRYTRAKMHLVDLAGSERVYKCAIQGTILTEAKHINLSLHFLEQVIVCLGQENVSHVPYRNSLLTSVLRDSLGGNCLTTMLANISVSNFNLEETISTCRFAQRVALVKNDVNLTFEIDTKSENLLLKMENEKLRREIDELKKRTIFDGQNFGGVDYYKNLVVQRDQEISHLIDLLEKERSRRKFMIKDIPVKEISRNEKYTQFPCSPSSRSRQNSPVKSETKRKIKPKTPKIQSPRKSESPGDRQFIFDCTKSRVPNLNLDHFQAEQDQPLIESNTPKRKDYIEINQLEIIKTPKINDSMEKNQLEIIKTAKINDSIQRSKSEITKTPKINDSLEINHQKKIKSPKTPELNIRDNDLLKFYEATNSVVDKKKSQVNNFIPKSESDKNNKKSIPGVEKLGFKVPCESTKAEDLNNDLLTPDTLKIPSDLQVVEKIESPKNLRFVEPKKVSKKAEAINVDLLNESLKILSDFKVDAKNESPKNLMDTQESTIFLLRADSENSKERRKEMSSGRKTPRKKIEFPQVMKTLRTSRNRPTSDEEKTASSSRGSTSGRSSRSDYKTPNIPRNVMCIEMDSPRLDLSEDKTLSNMTKKNSDETDSIVRIPLPLTGDPDIDEEIIAFYKAKQTGNPY